MMIKMTLKKSKAHFENPKIQIIINRMMQEKENTEQLCFLH